MKNLKKVLALVLAIACAFTMFAGAAFTDEADIQATDAVNMLTALGVIQGFEDGSFQPDKTVTRAEMAKMIFVVRNNQAEDDAYKTNSTKFADVNDHWAAGSIKFCESQGIIAGKSATQFKPNDTVTGVEAAKMLLVVAGYDPDKAGLTGANWKANTLKWAGSAGLLYDVNSPLEEGLPRQYAAQIIYNALDANRVKWSDDSNSFDDVLNGGVKETVGLAYMKLYKTVGTLVGIQSSDLWLGNAEKSESTATGHDRDGNPTFERSFSKVATDYSDLLGQRVKVMYKDGKTNSVMGVYALDDNTTYTVNASSVESDGIKVKFDGKSYSLDEYFSVWFTSFDGSMINGNYMANHDDTGDNNPIKAFTAETGITYPQNGKTEAEELFDDWNASSAVMTFIDSDDNGRLDNVIITDYAAAEVTSVTSSKIVAGKSYNYDDENIDDGIESGDWAVVSWDRYNDCQRIEKADVVTEKLNGLKKDSDSTNKLYKFHEYEIGDSWYNGGRDKNSYTELKTVKAGDDVSAIIVNGVVYKIRRTSLGDLSDVVDVAMVVNKEEGIGGDQVKLQFFNDTTKVVDVDKNSSVPYGNLTVGELYEYNVSGSEYSFEKYTIGGKDSYLTYDDDFYGDYTYKGKDEFTFGSQSSSTEIGGLKIDDKAKVILFQQATDKDGKKLDMGNKTIVINGKQLKALTSQEISGTASEKRSAHYFSADVSGITRAAALAMTVPAIPTMNQTYDHYGYILEDAKYSQGSNEISYMLLLEDSDEPVRVYEKSTNPSSRVANTLIGYKKLDNADAEKRYIDEVHLFKLDDAKDKEYFGLDAITDVNDKQNVVKFGKNTEHDITSETVIFYIDTDKKTGSSRTGTIREAVELTNDIDKSSVAVIKADKNYIANCLYVNKDDDDLDVLVVETGDRHFRGWYKDRYNAINGGSDPGTTDPTTPTDGTKTDAGNVTFKSLGVNSVGAATFNVTIARAAYVPADATIDVTYDLYADGTLESLDKTVTIGANASTVIERYITGNLSKDAKVEVKNIRAVPSKVIVKYVDKDGKDVSMVAGSSNTLTELSTSATSGTSSLPFTLNTGATDSSVLSYSTKGLYDGGVAADKTNQSWGVNANAKVLNLTGTNLHAKGNDFVTVTINGLENLVEPKVVKIASGFTSSTDTTPISTIGNVNATDGAKSVYLNIGASSTITLPTDGQSIKVTVNTSATLGKALKFTLSTNDTVTIKAGANTGFIQKYFTDSAEISITKVEELPTPTVESIMIVKSSGDELTASDSYANDDKIVITFSESMDATKTASDDADDIVAVATGSGSGTGALKSSGGANWSVNNTVLTLDVATALKSKNTLTLDTTKLVSAATGNAINAVIYVVQAEGTRPTIKS